MSKFNYIKSEILLSYIEANKYASKHKYRSIEANSTIYSMHLYTLFRGSNILWYKNERLKWVLCL